MGKLEDVLGEQVVEARWQRLLHGVLMPDRAELRVLPLQRDAHEHLEELEELERPSPAPIAAKRSSPTLSPWSDIFMIRWMRAIANSGVARPQWSARLVTSPCCSMKPDDAGRARRLPTWRRT